MRAADWPKADSRQTEHATICLMMLGQFQNAQPDPDLLTCTCFVLDKRREGEAFGQRHYGQVIRDWATRMLERIHHSEKGSFARGQTCEMGQQNGQAPFLDP